MLPIVPQGEFVGLSEVAEVLHVSKRTALRYSQRGDFPDPVDRLAAGPIWRRTEVAEWGSDYLPLPPGRPKRAGGFSPRGRS